MSCNFNAISCKTCPKYNGCLLQVIYTNTLMLNSMLENKLNSFSVEDNVDMFSKLDTISGKLEDLVKAIDEEETYKNETAVDIANLQSTISIIDSKLDDLIKSYNSYEYVPIINDKENIDV